MHGPWLLVNAVLTAEAEPEFLSQMRRKRSEQADQR